MPCFSTAMPEAGSLSQHLKPSSTPATASSEAGHGRLCLLVTLLYVSTGVQTSASERYGAVTPPESFQPTQAYQAPYIHPRNPWQLRRPWPGLWHPGFAATNPTGKPFFAEVLKK